MGRTLNEVMARLPKARRRAVEKRADELIAEELSLRDLRKALQLTQTDVAATLGKGQDEVSRIEQREDLLLSTLHGYVSSLGGELELVCTFKGAWMPPTARTTRGWVSGRWWTGRGVLPARPRSRGPRWPMPWRKPVKKLH